MLFSMSTKEEGRDEDAVSSRGGGLKESVWAQKPGRMGKGN